MYKEAEEGLIVERRDAKVEFARQNQSIQSATLLHKICSLSLVSFIPGKTLILKLLSISTIFGKQKSQTIENSGK